MELIGQSISHYKIIEKLGEGGMGVVYKAEDTKLKRIVALKFLPQHLSATAPEQARFLQEAQAAAALNHPNICAIHTIEEHEGSQFIDMEFVDGDTLRRRIPVEKLQDALSYAIQIAEALQEAHLKGIVHRDVKADNIMITARNQVKVMDFGLAKLKGSMKLTRASGTVGTLAYMAPEQLQGGEVDARSDIFSFGVVLYEMLAGHLPFRGEHEAAMMYSIVNEEPQPVQDHRPELSPDFVYIINKSLEKDPEDRYQAVNEMLVDMRRLKKQTTKVTRSQVNVLPTPGILRDKNETSGGSPASRPVGKNRWIAIGALSIVMAGALLYLLSEYLRKPNVPPALELSFSQLTDQPGVEMNPDISPDGNYIVYEKVDEYGPNVIYLERIGGGNPINLTGDTKIDAGQPAYSPDGQQIAFARWGKERGIFLMGATGENVRRLTDFGYTPSWSPDGKNIVCGTEPFRDPNVRGAAGSELWTISVATGEKKRIKTADAVQPQWSPHGSRIAYWGVHAGGRRDIWTIPSGGGDSLAVTDDAYVDWDPVWSPDGKYLYFSSDRGGSMNLWRIAIDEQSGKTLGAPQPVTTPSGNSGFLKISRDGRRLVYDAIDQRLNLYRVGFDPDQEAFTGTPFPVTQGTRMFGEFSPSPDGEWIALTSTGTQEDVFVIRKDGTGLRQLTNDVYKDRTVLWMPDGKQIAFMSDRSGEYEVWSIDADGSNLKQLTANTHKGFFIFPLFYVPDKHLLACGIDSGTVVVDLSKSLTDRREVNFPPPGSGSQDFVPWSLSPDMKMSAGFYAGPSRSGVAVYSMPDNAYASITDSGSAPQWLNDNRRLLYLRHGKIFIADRQTGKTHEIRNQPKFSFGYWQLSPDSHAMYYVVGSYEADIWEVTMKESQP